MAKFVDLIAIRGPDDGMRYSVEEGSYRVLGRRADFSDQTVHITPEGDRLLEPEQQAAFDAVMAERSARGERMRFKKRGADILLADDSVSRTHATVFADKDGASLADLMSTNGTKVNGVVVQDVDLKSGDVIRIGATEMRVKLT